MRANPAKWVALSAAAWEQHRGELRGKTHPARATLTYAPGGITLAPGGGKILKEQEQDLLRMNADAKLAAGEQIGEDHYDNPLNEIAGRVAVRISAYTTTCVVQLWQPGNTIDPQPTLERIWEAFHHPFNLIPGSVVQNLMFAEISNYVTEQFMSNAAKFEENLYDLKATTVAARVNEHASVPYGHSHVDALTAAHAPQSIAPQTAHDLTTTQRTEVQRGLIESLSENVENQLNKGAVKDIGIKDFPIVKQLLFGPPTGAEPNPLDAGLAKIPGISFLDAFEGISISEIAAADGMGNTLKDAVVI